MQVLLLFFVIYMMIVSILDKLVLSNVELKKNEFPPFQVLINFK